MIKQNMYINLFIYSTIPIYISRYIHIFLHICVNKKKTTHDCRVKFPSLDLYYRNILCKTKKGCRNYKYYYNVPQLRLLAIVITRVYFIYYFLTIQLSIFHNLTFDALISECRQSRSVNYLN